MAVGKTTALRYLQQHAPYINTSFEENADVIAEVKRRKLDKTVYADYLEIQKLWLRHEVERWKKAQAFPYTVMDFGAEEIVFYTWSYPNAMGKAWKIKDALYEELVAVEKCMPSRILFLDAPDEVLRERKEADNTRSREFFDDYMTKLLPLKRRWFYGRENVDILPVAHLSKEEVGENVKQWVDLCIQKYTANAEK